MKSRLEDIDPQTYAKIARSVPPSDTEAEEMLIGAMLRFPERFVDVMDLVTPDQFYSPQNGAIWEAMQYLHEDGVSIDVVTVEARLEEMNPFKDKKTKWKLQELCLEALHAASVGQWSERIAKLWKLRKLGAELSTLVSRAYENATDPDDLLEQIGEIEEKIESRSVSIAKTAGEVAASVIKNLAEARKTKKPTGIPTGIIDYDRAVGGIRRGELTIIAARPGQGKTAFAGNIATNIAGAVDGLPVLFCSIEMPDEDIVARMLSSLSGVNSIRIRDALTNDDEMARLEGARVKLAESKLWVADVPAVTVGQIAGLARRVKHKFGELGVVVVDYLQLINHHGGGQSREQELSYISRKLKQLARQLNCGVVALSQLNRKCEERADKRPLLSDLRESGAIEQDADIVAAIFREEIYNQGNDQLKGVAELNILKARKGGVGTINLRYEGSTTTFQNLAHQNIQRAPAGSYSAADM